MPGPDSSLTLARPEQDALLDRLAHANVRATVRGIPMRGIDAAVERHCSPEVAGQLRQRMKLDLSAAPTSKRSVVEFLQYELVAARTIGVVLGSFERGVEACGAGAMQLFFDNRAGQAMLSLAKQNPHKLLGSVPVAFQFMFDFGRRRWRSTGEREGIFDADDDLLGPVYTFGFLAEAIRHFYGVEAVPELTQRDLLTFSLQLRW